MLTISENDLTGEVIMCYNEKKICKTELQTKQIIFISMKRIQYLKMNILIEKEGKYKLDTRKNVRSTQRTPVVS